MRTQSLVVLTALCLAAYAQTSPAPDLKGKYERIKVHGKSLEGNLNGDSPDRDVSIYLPASYANQPARRYPVLYLLHGFTDTDARWFGVTKHFINVPVVVDKAAAAGANEMIVVMPNAFTTFEGSMYSNSAAVGDWETYVAKELVAYVDSHYRTLATPAARGLAGHSMGGYGTIRIAMKQPGVFSSLYLLSPCCMAPPAGARPNPAAEAVKTRDEIAKANFFTKAALASAAAWSPNPANPPFFIDLPSVNGEVLPEVLARWTANAPLAMLDQYLPALRTYKAIVLDAGDKDEPIATTVRSLADRLKAYGIANTSEIYPGDHVNRIAERVELKVIPFFSKQLSTK